MRIDQDVRRDIEEVINGLVWDWSMDIVCLGGGRMNHDDRRFVLRW